ncbi:DUF2274 domain-containing protein [Jannaschia sp. S6380]|uniref:DUF2274 domain-containing protein n=1 Tax=Jannaschia sp. S6380 TaxID=2926408 RepID=UPI001FF47FE9|nr:DUF2274 domain-containing protein [Jannaschia sp. S6380]MCK0166663.1 DUF2274 domain-containing protein [Jannaschia sp. S6380]
MTKLKLGPIHDDKPVKLTVELPADVHRDLCDYAAVLGHQTGQDLEPARLVAPMLARFMSTDRGFATARKTGSRASRKKPPDAQAQPDGEQG